MKIVSKNSSEKELIAKAINNDAAAQRMLYSRYAPKMLSVCRQYIKDLQFAEDTLVNGFVKVFRHLAGFKHEGSFEGWIRRIMIRESISFLRKRQFVVYDDEVFERGQHQVCIPENDLDIDDIQLLIDQLPDGYRTVFLLFIVEGYKHQEIAKILKISESTSKTQLFRARKILQEKLIAKNIIGYGTK